MQTKVVVFDFDGTLTISKSSTWVRIWQKVNALDVDEQLYQKFISGEIDYNTWLTMGFNEIKKRGYTESNLNELVKKIKLLQNTEDVFAYLKEKNIKIYILSGGIKTIIERALGKLKNYVSHIEACNFLFDKQGNLSDLCTLTHNPENKQEFVNYILKLEGVQPKEVVFIGNGKNDESVYKTGVNTLCLNPDNANYTNKKIWHNVVETESLKDILPYISC